MAAYGYMAKIGADTSGLQSALKDINSSIKSTDSELRKVKSSIKEAEQAGTDRSDLLKQKEDVLGSAVSDTAEKLEKLRSIEEQMKNAADNNSISAEQYRDYQRELANTEAELKKYQTELIQTRQEENNMLGSGQVITASLQDIQNAAKKVGEDLSWFTDKIKSVADAALGYGEKMVKYSLDVGSAFESSMSKVQAYSGAVGDDFTALENAAKDAGATTSKSASEAADALGYMTLAGWDTQEMLDGLMPVLRASEASGADLARTSDLVTDSMSAMGISTSELTHYLDVCTAAQSNSNTTLTGLLEAYVGCGGTLKNLNVPLEESAALLGTLADRGIKASEAGTSLNSILVNLIGANKSASDAMDTLGVSAWDENGNFIGLSETLKVLSGALESCTDEQKAFFEAKIGGKTQMDTLQALIAGVNDEYDELYNTLVNSEGALESTSKTMQDNLAGAITTMKSALEALGDEFYDYLEEPAKDAVNGVTEALRTLTESVDKGELRDALGNLSGKMSDLIEKLVEFASDKGIDLVIDGLSKFIDLLSWLIDNLDTVSGLAKGLGAAFLTIKAGELAIDVLTLVGTISSLAAAAEAGTAAATVLSAALSAIPLVAVGALAIGAATAFTSMMDAEMDSRVHLEHLRSETDKFIESLIDETAKLEEVNSNIEENNKKVDENCDKAKDLWEQLQELCDEEGNVNGAYEEAQSLIDQLNGLTDSHITLIGDQIQGYDDLCSSMDNYIERLRSTAKLEYMHDDYVKAIGRRDELQGKLDTANDNYFSAKNKRSSFEDSRKYGIINSVTDFISYDDAIRITGTPEWNEFRQQFEHDHNGRIPEVWNMDDYGEFLAWQEQQALTAVHFAQGDIDENNKTIEKYETESANLTQIDTKIDTKNDGSNSPAAMAAKESAGNNQAATKQQAEEQTQADSDKMTDVISQLESIDNDYSFGKITSEEDYYAKLESVTEPNKSLFEKYPAADEYKVFKRYLDKVKSYKNKQNKSGGTGGKSSSGSGKKSGSGSKEDDPERIASQAISSAKSTLTDTKELEDWDDEKYYDELRKFIDDPDNGIDKNTEAYKKADSEIKIGYKKASEKAVDDLIKEYESENIDKETLKNRLNALISYWQTKNPKIAEYAKNKYDNAKAPKDDKAETAAKSKISDKNTSLSNWAKTEGKTSAEVNKARLDWLESDKWTDEEKETAAYRTLYDSTKADVAADERTAAGKTVKDKFDTEKERLQKLVDSGDMTELQMWQELDKYYNDDSNWTEIEKSTDEYKDIADTIADKTDDAETKAAKESFKKKIGDEKKRLERLVEEGSMTKAEMWAALEDFYNDDSNFTEAERNTKDYKEYADTISDEKDDAEFEQKQSDKKEAEKKFISEYDDLAEKRKNDLISEEEYQEELLALKEKYAEYGIDISEHIAEKEQEIGEKKLEDIQKKYDDLDKNIDKRASELTKGSLDSGKLYEEKDLANNGGKKKIFTDLNAKANDIKKYTEDLKKLRATDIPQDLMNEILAMDYEGRKDVISELLKMSESSRNLYYDDYNKWHAEAQKAAELEYSDEKADLDEELANSAGNALADTADIAGAYGKEAAQAYIDGWNELLQQEGLSIMTLPQTVTVADKSDKTENSVPAELTAGDKPLTSADAHSIRRAGDNFIRVDPSTPITINVGGEKVIQKQIKEFLGQNRISDGNNVNI